LAIEGAWKIILFPNGDDLLLIDLKMKGFVYDFQDWLVSLRKTGKDEPISNSFATT
jgi:hypothetical protein